MGRCRGREDLMVPSMKDQRVLGFWLTANIKRHTHTHTERERERDRMVSWCGRIHRELLARIATYPCLSQTIRCASIKQKA